MTIAAARKNNQHNGDTAESGLEGHDQAAHAGKPVNFTGYRRDCSKCRSLYPEKSNTPKIHEGRMVFDRPADRPEDGVA